MPKYDVNIHMPQRVENLLNIVENGGTLEQFGYVLDDIKTIINDNGFIQDLHDWEKQKERQLKELDNEYLDKLRNIIKDNDFNSVIVEFSEIIKAYEKNINIINKDYVDTVKTYILGYVPQVDIKGYE